MPGENQPFLDIGRHCSAEGCHQLDFLPFNCPSCELPFCAEHWRPPSGHTCTKYDPRLFDNRVPSCPLCSTPIPIPPQTDPNLPMDSHLSTSCPILHPHLPKPKPANVCNAPKCKVKMVVPIQCDECGGKFCPQHRWRADHKCEGRPQAKANGGGGAPKGAATGGGGAKKVFGLSVGGRSAAADRAAAASTRDRPTAASRPTPTTGLSGLAALRRAQNARASTPSSKLTATAKLGTSANPLVLDDSSDSSDDLEILPPHKPKTTTTSSTPSSSSRGSSTPATLANVGLGSLRTSDRRARAEQESARKALEARAKKGLLTEDEKVRYATVQALQQQQRGSSGGKGAGEGCVVA
ncbi:hypothetical protein JCM1840_004133 [Sporobolomyces johnsonii]